MQGESFAALSPIKPEPEDPEKAVLKGKLRMVILHVDKEIAAAKISGSESSALLATAGNSPPARLRHLPRRRTLDSSAYVDDRSSGDQVHRRATKSRAAPPACR